MGTCISKQADCEEPRCSGGAPTGGDTTLCCAAALKLPAAAPPVGCKEHLAPGSPCPTDSTSVSSMWSADSSLEPPAAACAPSKARSSGTPVQEVAGPLSDLQLGPVIGTWCNSLCYRGTWQQRQPVSVMITDHLAADEEAASQLEATLGHASNSAELEHPNLVKVHRCSIEHPQLPTEDLLAGCCWEGEGDGSGCGGGDCEDDGWLCWGNDRNNVGTLQWEGSSPRKHLQVWTISELCGQGTLETAITRGWLRQGSTALGQGQRKPHMSAILDTAQEIAAALHHLHSHGLVHGALDGASVLLCPATGDRPFIAKLSSACHLLSQKNEPRCLTLRLDRAAHTAPEVLLGSGQLESQASNTYSLGVLLYEMWSGTLAWDSLSSSQMMRDMLARRPVLPLLPGCPPQYQALITECIAPDPDARPTVQTVLAALQQLAANSSNLI